MEKVSKLYAIVDTLVLEKGQLIECTKALLKGGCRWIQYRDKSKNTAKRLEEASQLNILCKEAGAHLIINDDVALASSIKASGVHLGQGDTPISEARKELGAESIIGITCHDSPELAAQAKLGGASYIAFGRFFPSSTKPNAQAADQKILGDVQQFSLPVVAIGGITLENGSQLIHSGANALAVCHNLITNDDVERQTRRYLNLFN